MPRNIPEEQKTQLQCRLRVWHRQEILTRKAEDLSGTLKDVAIYETTLFHNPKDHHVVSIVHQESKRERSENERWEFLTSHVCRHFCTHTRYVKPVYWRTCNVHEPYKIKSMKRRHMETSKMFSMLSTSKEVSEFSLGLYVIFFIYSSLCATILMLAHSRTWKQGNKRGKENKLKLTKRKNERNHTKLVNLTTSECHQLASWSGVLQKPTVSKLVRRFLNFNEIQKFD